MLFFQFAKYLIDATTANGRPVACICTIGLFTFLMGCQPRSYPLPHPPPPLVAPRPQPVLPTFYVNVNYLNLRVCPSTKCPKICTLELNAEVEKMGETGNWTQIKVKKNGTIGYVSSRYLSSHPVKVARHTRKRTRKTKLSKKNIKNVKTTKAIQVTIVPEKEGEIRPNKHETSLLFPDAM
jgi:uncharacterized protein YraI